MRIAEPRRAPPGGAPSTKSAEDVVHAFGPNREAGLLDERVAKRRERYGPNELAETPPEAIWKKLLAQFDDAPARRRDPPVRAADFRDAQPLGVRMGAAVQPRTHAVTILELGKITWKRAAGAQGGG